MDQETTVEIERLQVHLRELGQAVRNLQKMTILHAKDLETLQKPLRDPARVPPTP